MWKTQIIKIISESKHLQDVFINLPEEVTLFSRLYDLTAVTTCCDPDFIFCCGDHSRNFLIPQIKVIFPRKENPEDYVSLAFLKQWYNFSCFVMDQWTIERNLWSISCFPDFVLRKKIVWFLQWKQSSRHNRKEKNRTVEGAAGCLPAWIPASLPSK